MSIQAIHAKTASTSTPEQRQSLIQSMVFVVAACLTLMGHTILTAWLGAPGLLWLAGVTIASMFVSIEFAYALLMAGLFLENGFVSFFVPLINDPTHYRVLLASNLINIFLSAALGGMAWLKWRARMPPQSRDLLLWLLFFTVAVVFYTLLGAAQSSFSNALVYARVYLVGILMLITGAVLGLRLELSFAINIVRILSLILVSWGTLEFLFPYEFYDVFHIKDYLNLKALNLDYTASFGSISEAISMKSNSFLNLSGQFGLDLFYLRPRGPNLHSISFGYALAFCCLICFINRFRFMSLACFLLAIIVGAKGPLLLTMGTVAIYAFYNHMRRSRAWLAVAVLSAMLLYLVTGLVYGAASQDYHVLGFMGGVNGFFKNPFGHGIGMGGTMSTQGIQDTDFEEFQHLGSADFALESAFGVLIYQLGIGALVFLTFYWKLWRSVWQASQFFATESRLVVIPIVLALLLVNSVFQEEAFSPLGWGLWLMFSGLLIGRHWWQADRTPTPNTPAALQK